MNVAVETHHLSKSYEAKRGWRRIARQRPVAAVQEVSLSVPAGELFGLLGPNGAGKTTLVKMLCTLILPSSGAATVAGHRLDQAGQIRQAVGLVVADERSFYWRLSGRRNLEFFAAMHGLHGAAAQGRIDQVLAEVELQAAAGRPFSGYSTGMRQRLAIARSLLHRPQLLFLDEPSRSLDPSATLRLHDLIRGLRHRQGVTVFLITHDLAEAEKLCDRVAVMHQGRIQVVGRPADLRHQLRPQMHYAVRVGALTAEAEAAVGQIIPDVACEQLNGQTRLTFQAGEEDGRLAAVLECLRQYGRQIVSIEGQPPTLEEVFAHYTGAAPERREVRESEPAAATDLGHF